MPQITKDHSARKPEKKVKVERLKPYTCEICKEVYRMTAREYALKPKAFKRACFKKDCRTAYSFKKTDKLMYEKKKIENKAWKVRKEKLASESGKIKIDSLQISINTIVKLIDKDRPCLARPFDGNTKMDAGHVFPRSSATGLRYQLWNIHSQGKYSNSRQTDDALMREGLAIRYGDERLEWLEDQRRQYPVLRDNDFDKKGSLKTANKIIREWDKNPMDRDQVNAALNIYK